MELTTSVCKRNTISYSINEGEKERKSQSKIVSSRSQVESLFPMIVNNVRTIYRFEMEVVLYVKGIRKNVYVHQRRTEDFQYLYKSRMKMRDINCSIKLYYPIPQIYFEHMIVYNFLYAQMSRMKKQSFMDLNVLNWMLVNYFSQVREKEYASKLYGKFWEEEKGYGYVEKKLGRALKMDSLSFEQIIEIFLNHKEHVKEDMLENA